jgi:hypothetical protein
MTEAQMRDQLKFLADKQAVCTFKADSGQIRKFCCVIVGTREMAVEQLKFRFSARHNNTVRDIDLWNQDAQEYSLADVQGAVGKVVRIVHVSVHMAETIAQLEQQLQRRNSPSAPAMATGGDDGSEGMGPMGAQGACFDDPLYWAQCSPADIPAADSYFSIFARQLSSLRAPPDVMNRAELQIQQLSAMFRAAMHNAFDPTHPDSQRAIQLAVAQLDLMISSRTSSGRATAHLARHHAQGNLAPYRQQAYAAASTMARYDMSGYRGGNGHRGGGSRGGGQRGGTKPHPK